MVTRTEESTRTKVAETSLLVIVGPTASGKSALALRVAEASGGEIICADSRTVYQGMDIGTAKPTAEEQARVPHHLLDVASPDESFTTSDFLKLAKEVISQIQARGRLPVIVGGTGLYVDSLVFGFTLGDTPDTAERQALERLDLMGLQALATRRQLQPSPGTWTNPRHLRRFIERGGTAGNRQPEPPPGTLMIGLNPPMAVLEQRISARVDAMLAAGLAAEAGELGQRFGWDCPAMSGIGYRECRGFGEDSRTLDQLRTELLTDTRRYAKRQLTWFKRNPFIHWFAGSDEAFRFVAQAVQQNGAV